MTDKAAKLAAYPKSEHGNFEIADTIGVPHPYMITPRHVAYASDHHMGMLGEAAIEGCERNGGKCGMPRCTLSYKQHEQALLVRCHKPLKDGAVVNAELQAYLLSIKEQAEKDGFVGFAFLNAEKGAGT